MMPILRAGNRRDMPPCDVAAGRWIGTPSQRPVQIKSTFRGNENSFCGLESDMGRLPRVEIHRTYEVAVDEAKMTAKSTIGIVDGAKISQEGGKRR